MLVADPRIATCQPMESGGNTGGSQEAGGLEKLIDRLPHADFGLRRRLITGLILAALLTLYTYAFPMEPGLWAGMIERTGINLTTAAGSTQVMILAILLLYAVGAVTEVISDGFIVRGASLASVWLSAGLPVNILVLPLLPALMLSAIVWSSIRYTGYKVQIADSELSGTPGRLRRLFGSSREPLSAEARGFYETKLPPAVRAGLNEPFGGKFEAAWQVLLTIAPEPQKSWIAGLRARNHELSSFLSAAFAATTLYLVLYVSRMKATNLGGASALYFILWFVAHLFLGYLSLVRRAIALSLEFLAAVAAMHRTST